MPVAPPRPKGPHLNALRAFEAAARLGSFTAAAEELGVTPGAVTQHIKSIESWSRAPLFKRNARGVVLTPLAIKLLPGFTEAFDQLGRAVHDLRSESMPRQLSIATLPSIAQLWLPRRLETLRKREPGISISVTALETPPNLNREQFDLSIFFEDRPDTSNSLSLGEDQVFPVCAPELAAHLTTPASLGNAILLRDSTWNDDWENWLDASGVTLDANTPSQTYSLFAVALEEARRGAGVLISHLALVEPALRSGDLVQPFKTVFSPRRRLTLTMSRSFKSRQVRDVVVEVLT